MAEKKLAATRNLLHFGMVFMATGILLELLLLGHVENASQWIPVLLTGFLLLTVLALFMIRTKLLFILHQIFCGLGILSGIVGVWLHFEGNVAFEKEMYPNLPHSEIWIEALTGATPALAPGSMIALGIFGMVLLRLYKIN